ncbi:hypothetical protein F5888DRAFT_1632975 [Russula emetica]|nr:hypothetical protein F5888DRAFT_1632975 [Russula emetica]
MPFGVWIQNWQVHDYSDDVIISISMPLSLEYWRALVLTSWVLKQAYDIDIPAEPGRAHESQTFKFVFVNRVHDSDEEQLGLARLGTPPDTFWSRHLPRVEAPIRQRSPTGHSCTRSRSASNTSSRKHIYSPEDSVKSRLLGPGPELYCIVNHGCGHPHGASVDTSVRRIGFRVDAVTGYAFLEQPNVVDDENEIVAPSRTLPPSCAWAVLRISVAEPGFNWIDVDSSHGASVTFLDKELAGRLARKETSHIHIRPLIGFSDDDWLSPQAWD